MNFGKFLNIRLIYYYYAGKIAADLLRYPQYLKGLDIKELEANAEKHLKRLLKAEQFKLQANASLALFYAQKSDWTNAFVYATAASKDVPDDPTMLNIIGLAAYNTGNNDIAIQTLEKVITIAPNNPVYHRDLGMAYKKAKNYSLAKNHFEKCIASKNCPEELRTYAFRELESLKNLQETNNGY